MIWSYHPGTALSLNSGWQIRQDGQYLKPEVSMSVSPCAALRLACRSLSLLQLNRLLKVDLGIDDLPDTKVTAINRFVRLASSDDRLRFMWTAVGKRLSGATLKALADTLDLEVTSSLKSSLINLLRDSDISSLTPSYCVGVKATLATTLRRLVARKLKASSAASGLAPRASKAVNGAVSSSDPFPASAAAADAAVDPHGSGPADAAGAEGAAASLPVKKQVKLSKAQKTTVRAATKTFLRSQGLGLNLADVKCGVSSITKIDCSRGLASVAVHKVVKRVLSRKHQRESAQIESARPKVVFQ